MAKQPTGKRRYRQKRKWYIPVLAIAVAALLGSQLIGLYTKLSDHRQREAQLGRQLEDALTRQQELQEYEAYTGTDEYIQNTARSKLGMVKVNEIVFKQR